jgi:pimeloyl-ACP methyl ester carboxylesterase
MPVFTRPDAEIHYEVYGAGHPLLLFAPGGLRSQLQFWRHSPANPDAPAAWMHLAESIRRVSDFLTKHTP